MTIDRDRQRLDDEPPAPSPEQLLRLSIGSWMCAIVAAAVRLGAFGAIEAGARNAALLAAAIAIGEREAQALLDGLLGLGLVTLKDGHYRNSADASYYLLPARPDYLGDFVLLGAADLGTWARLSEAVRSGEPLRDAFAPDDRARWDEMVRGIAPLALAGARALAEPLQIETRGAFRMLDLGGGAGAYSAVWLALNPQARSVQIDRAEVNHVARDYVAGFGVGDRFETRDGDVHELDCGEARCDVVVLSLVCHFFSPGQNLALLRKARRALNEGGQLCVIDLMLGEQRTGALWPLAFSANMLLSTRHGGSYRRDDYIQWLRQVGFERIEPVAVEAMPYEALVAYR